MVLRSLALFVLLVAGCGDDTRTATPDMNAVCAAACNAINVSGDPCPTAGVHCTCTPDADCTCGSDLRWSCKGWAPTSDMARSRTD